MADITVGDALAEVNGVKPNKLPKDGEEVEIRADTKKYKIKRKGDDLSCSCPAWRFQKKPADQRTCKHLRDLLGDPYENARTGQPDTDDRKPKSRAKDKPASKGGKTPRQSGKRKREEEEEEEESPGQDPDVKAPEPAEDGADDDDEDPDADPLNKIKGISPNVLLADGEEKEVSSQTSSSTYRIKRTGDHYYCTCPAWRMQSSAPVNARSCKHLKAILGEAYENARIQMMNPGASTSSGKARAPSSKKAKVTKAPELLLAVKWDLESGADPTGWWASEKLDGVRAYFDGKSFLSRLGNPFSVPQNLIDVLPKDVKLDGELFGGRKKFNETVSIVRSSQSKKWSEGVVTYQIFDILSTDQGAPFEDRMEKLKEYFGPNGTHKSDFAVLLEHTAIRDRDHIFEMLKEVEDLGGEGLMIRKPGSGYEGRRSNTLMKIKTFYDAEAEVTGYEPGKGKHKGVTGALKCKMESGKTFRVGTGLSDAQRKNPPKIGAIITYRFQELTPDRVPRFPSYVGEAIDKTEPKDADVPSSRKEGVKDDDEA